MEDDALKQVQQSIKDVEPKLQSVKKMVGILKAAGESVTEVENQLRELERKKTRWENALKSAGY